MIEQKIVDLLDQKFKEEDFLDCFLIDIQLAAGQKLEVFVDSDTGINLEKCQKISRYLEQYLDEEGWLGPEYTLDVSSPGIDRPLKIHRQYLKNIGRKVEIKTKDGKERTGTLIALEADTIVLEEKVTVKEGKRKKSTIVQSTIPFQEIEKTIVQISFKK
ncbi:MAG: ribosome assembly cofactor RimP [Saprospiraceae bacterium]